MCGVESIVFAFIYCLAVVFFILEISDLFTSSILRFSAGGFEKYGEMNGKRIG
jgi:formate/nitrite transporter FocA (FNT family)